jgi:hypothetical protein
MIDQIEINNLLIEFNRLEPRIQYVTYLGTCKYPGSRFEEVCSRILAFFFDNNAEHGFKNMMLKSFIEAVGCNIPIDSSDKIKVNLEHPCPYTNKEGETTILKLDLLLQTPEYIIGIEHKINAELYNNLEAYSTEVQKIADEKKIKYLKVVLSLKKVVALNKAERAGFIILQYSAFCNAIKNNIGAYLNNCNPSFLNMLLDFIKTIETMENSVINNIERYKFYFEKSLTITKLISEFNTFKNEVSQEQGILFQNLLEKVNEGETHATEQWNFFKGDEDDPSSLFWNRLISGESLGLELNISKTIQSSTGNISLYMVYWGDAHEIKSALKPLWDRLKKRIKPYENYFLEEDNNVDKARVKLYQFSENNTSNFQAVVNYYECQFEDILKESWDFDIDKFRLLINE